MIVRRKWRVMKPDWFLSLIVLRYSAAKSTPQKARESSGFTSQAASQENQSVCNTEYGDCVVATHRLIESSRALSSEGEASKVRIALKTPKMPPRRKIVPKQKNSPRPEQKQQPLTQQRARGTLHGLSTLRRHGNVRVTRMSDYIAVRSNFVLGPLVLKVEKPFGRGAKREMKRATATTTQMIGRINLRIVSDKATLHSIKVQQPKQVSGLTKTI